MELITIEVPVDKVRTPNDSSFLLYLELSSGTFHSNQSHTSRFVLLFVKQFSFVSNDGAQPILAASFLVVPIFEGLLWEQYQFTSAQRFFHLSNGRHKLNYG